MGLLPDDTILVSGKRISKLLSNTPPSFVKFNRITRHKVCNVVSEYLDTPDGMTVLTSITGEDQLAFSYRLV